MMVTKKRSIVSLYRILIAALLLSSAGCGVLRIHASYFPQDGAAYHEHPLGVKIYNSSGYNLSDAWRDYIFDATSRAEKRFTACIGPVTPELRNQLFSIPVVVLPAEDLIISGSTAHALTTLDAVFIPQNRFSEAVLVHEWLHIYLFYTGKRFFGDPLHRDELFKKCFDYSYST